MGKTKEMFEKLNHEQSAVDFYNRLRLLKQWEEELVDPKVPENVKRIIIKSILA